jgi:Zn-finger nucleic acid-binding protein
VNLNLMHCPICNQHLQHYVLPESEVPAYQCQRCKGIYIASNEYLRWVKGRAQTAAPALTPDPNLPDYEVAQLKLCPGCGHFLTRFKLLPHTRFFVDHCSNCNGVWLDHDEWDVLVEHNLHDRINDLFTTAWQTKLRSEETRITLDTLYREKFGEDDYQHLQEVRDWLSHHPQRAMMLAFLQSADPYKMNESR